MKIAALILIVLAVLIFGMKLFGKPKSDKRNKAARKPVKGTPISSTPYGATAIVAGDGACGPAREISGKRFLNAEGKTPRIPLPECDVPECHCRYQKFRDRREYDDDRRAPTSLAAELYGQSGQKEHRKQKGRREGDWS